MKRALAVASLLLVTGTAAAAPPTLDAIDESARSAFIDGKYAFCTEPDRPLGDRQRGLCSLAAETKDCGGLVAACEAANPPAPDWLAKVVKWLAPVARIALYVLALAIVLVIVVPVVRAISRLRRRKKRPVAAEVGPNVARPVGARPPPPDVLDPEDALRLAEEARARGEHGAALGLYLAAALAALDRRGAIRIARHRTNGEYVRACAEDAARPPLREIVREVDAVEFGGATATNEGALRIAARAQAIVRSAAVVALLLLASCSPQKHGADPAGDELPLEVLRRNGFQVGVLPTSLSTMPVPEEDAAPVVVIDVDRVPLDDETQAHLMRWTEAGGTLVLFGRVGGWPAELAPKAASARSRDLVVGADLHARVASAAGFTWADGDEPLGHLGQVVYAAKRRIGKGTVLGVANDDLMTNLGIMPPHNAAALVTLLRSATRDARRSLAHDAKVDVRVARAEDGVPPPSSPFAALLAAGLAKGSWHALGAAILLFLAYGIRHSRARAVPAKPRRAFIEHIEATGAFYDRAQAHVHALGAYGRFVELRLRELGARGADPAALLAARSGASPERAAKVYARALATKPDAEAEGDELAVLEELRAMTAKL